MLPQIPLEALGMLPGMGDAAAGAGKGIGSMFEGINNGVDGLASGIDSSKGGIVNTLKGNDTANPISKGLDFLFGDDEEKKKFEKLEIDKLEIDKAEIGKLIISSLTEDKKDFEEIKEDKAEDKALDISDKLLPTMETITEIPSVIGDDSQLIDTLGSPLEGKDQLGDDSQLKEFDSPGRMYPLEGKDQSGDNSQLIDTLGSPLEGISDSNLEVSAILEGKGQFGGGVGDISFDTETMSGQLDDISGILDKPDPILDYELLKKALGGGGEKGFFEDLAAGILAPVKMAWGMITDIATGAWTVITDTVSGLWTGLTDTVSGLWTGLTDTVSGLWTGVTDTVSGLWTGVKDIAGGIVDTIGDAASSAWEGVKDIAGGVVDTIGDAASSAWEGVKDIAGGVFEGAKDVAGGVFEGAKDVAGGIWSGVGDVFGFETGDEGATIEGEKILTDIYGCLLEIKEIISNGDMMFSNYALEEPEPTMVISGKAEELISTTQLLEDNIKLKAIEGPLAMQSNTSADRSLSGSGTRTMENKRGPYRPGSAQMGNANNTERYTKTPPPLVPSSIRNLDELQSYLAYPQWRRMLG